MHQDNPLTSDWENEETTLQKSKYESLCILQKVFFESQILQDPQANNVCIQAYNGRSWNNLNLLHKVEFFYFFLKKSLYLNLNSFAYTGTASKPTIQGDGSHPTY